MTVSALPNEPEHQKHLRAGQGKTAPRPADYLVVCTLFPLVMICGIYGISRHPWPTCWDAADYAVRSMELTQALGKGLGPFLDRFPGSHGPLMPILNTVALAALPRANPFWVMTSIQVVLLALTACLAYALVRSVAGIPAALMIVALYLLSPIHAYWSTQIMHEGPGYVLLAAFLLACVHDYRQQSPKSVLITAAALGFLCLTRLNFAIPALLAFVPYLIRRIRSAPYPERRNTVVCFLLPIISIAGLWYAATIRHLIQHARFTNTWSSHTPAAGDWLTKQTLYLGYLWREWGSSSFIILIAATAAAAPFLLSRKHRDAFPLGLTAAGFVLILFALCILAHNKNERFLTPMLLPALFMLAWALQTLRSRKVIGAMAQGTVVLLLMLQVGSFADRFISPLPRSARRLLYANSSGPTRPLNISSAARTLLSTARTVFPPQARVLFIGHGRNLNNIYMKYWNAIDGYPLRLEYAWTHLSPRAAIQKLPRRIENSEHVILYKARQSDGAAYRKASQAAESTLTDLSASGRATVISTDKDLNVTLYRLSNKRALTKNDRASAPIRGLQ